MPLTVCRFEHAALGRRGMRRRVRATRAGGGISPFGNSRSVQQPVQERNVIVGRPVGGPGVDGVAEPVGVARPRRRRGSPARRRRTAVRNGSTRRPERRGRRAATTRVTANQLRGSVIWAVGQVGAEADPRREVRVARLGGDLDVDRSVLHLRERRVLLPSRRAGQVRLPLGEEGVVDDRPLGREVPALDQLSSRTSRERLAGRAIATAPLSRGDSGVRDTARPAGPADRPRARRARP